jgi:hypothetical protein
MTEAISDTRDTQGAPELSLGRRLREYFSLHETEARQRKLGEARRAELADAAALGLQKRDAAESLLLAGDRVEALGLAREAFGILFELAGAIDDPIAAHTLVQRARRELEAAPQPRLESEYAPVHATQLARLLDASALIHRRVAPVVGTTQALGRARASRLGAVAFVVLAVAAGLVWRARRPPVISTEASSVHSDKYGSDAVVDGVEGTEWLLPDGATGWLDLKISPPRSVKRVRLLNSHNSPHNDRATNEYALEIYGGGKLVKTIEGTLGPLSPTPKWQAVDVDAAKVERIRFVVKSVSGAGGGLAEVKIE